MRHLPNILTLANLFCGCLAIVSIINAQPFLYRTETGEAGAQWAWAYGVQQLQWGAIFIFLAGVFDLLDGFAARALRVSSELGADLDSLADVVSFGVAPSMIFYKLLWDCVSREPNVTNVDMLSLAPAFLIACFGALRLARFNVTPSKGPGFTGMPIPAVGIFVASLALADWDSSAGWTGWLFSSRWALYALIALLCYLMVSKIPFLKLMPSKWTIADAWPQAVLVAVTLAAIPFLHYSAIPLAFGVYILLSLIAPKAKPVPAV